MSISESERWSSDTRCLSLAVCSDCVLLTTGEFSPDSVADAGGAMVLGGVGGASFSSVEVFARRGVGRGAGVAGGAVVYRDDVSRHLWRLSLLATVRWVPDPAGLGDAGLIGL